MSGHLFLVYSILQALLVVGVSGASYDPYQYDWTVLQFTPDGRLLQVEYASAAADHSSPIVVATLNDDMTILIASKSKNKVQERLILLPESDTIIGITGVLADSLALVQTVQRMSLENRKTSGKSLTAQQVAHAIGSACHVHALGGGIRCCGSTLVICGVEQESTVLFQTDPSGALKDLVARKNPFAVIGGRSYEGGIGASIQQRLGKKLGTAQARSSEELPSVMITNIVKLVVKEHVRSGKLKMEDLVFEIAVASKQHGTYKLSSEQVDNILARL